MARMPIAGSDSGTWGDILNEFLAQAHTFDGSLKAGSVGSAQIQDGAIASNHIAGGITKSSIGLGNVDNTSDAAKPASQAVQTLLDSKVNEADLTGLIDDYIDNSALATRVVSVAYDDLTGWPARPTADANVVVHWYGGDTSPPGALDGIDYWVRPATVEDVVPGSTITVYRDGGNWPLRPTERTDVTVYWIGGDEDFPPPSGPEFSGIDIWIRSGI